MWRGARALLSSFLLGAVSMLGFRMTTSDAALPRAAAHSLAQVGLSRILSFYSHTQLGANQFQNKMKLPEALGTLPTFCKHFELSQKMACFHECSCWHNWSPGDSRTMNIPGADAARCPVLYLGGAGRLKLEQLRSHPHSPRKGKIPPFENLQPKAQISKRQQTPTRTKGQSPLTRQTKRERRRCPPHSARRAS